MFNKFHLAVSLATILAVLPSNVKAGTPVFPMPTIDSIHAASAAARASHCESTQCRSIETIAEAMDDLLAAQATSMGITTPVPASRDLESETRLDHLLLNHPQAFAPVCDALTRLARQYPPGDLFVAVGSMQLALRIDLRALPSEPGFCLSKVIEAFPDSPQADTAITNAGILCQNAWKLGSSCARLRR